MTTVTPMSQLPVLEAAGSRPSPRTLWTLVGICAIPLWALWPLFAVIAMDSMPMFELMAVTYGVAALSLLALRRLGLSGSAAKRQAVSWVRTILPALMVSVGALLSNVLFLLAIRYIPAAQANLIVYLWPLMIAALCMVLGLVRIQPHHLVSMLLGLAGAACVIGLGDLSGSWTGIGLAAASGLAWAVFCVFRLWQGADAPDALASGFAFSAIIAGALHLGLETTMMPSWQALLSAVLNGIVSLALGNLAWDQGIRRGNHQLLTVFAYATPLVSALLLIAFGYAQASLGLLLGGILIVTGSVVSVRR